MNPCDACGSSKTELDESSTGSVFLCCKECGWVMLYDEYVKEGEPENYGDD